MINLEFDIEGIREIQVALGATDRQVNFSMARAFDRTAATLRKMSSQGFRSELGLRNLAYIRKRLKSIKLRGGGGGGVKLWYGLNDMPLSYLKGTVRKQRRGAPASKTTKLGNFSFPNSFVVANPKSGRGKTLFHRVGRARMQITEDQAPIKDKMDVFIEDEIFDKVPEIFWHHFSADLRARVKYPLIDEASKVNSDFALMSYRGRGR